MPPEDGMQLSGVSCGGQYQRAEQGGKRHQIAGLPATGCRPPPNAVQITPIPSSLIVVSFPAHILLAANSTLPYSSRTFTGTLRRLMRKSLPHSQSSHVSLSPRDEGLYLSAAKVTIKHIPIPVVNLRWHVAWEETRQGKEEKKGLAGEGVSALRHLMFTPLLRFPDIPTAFEMVTESSPASFQLQPPIDGKI
ncbi:hypothetical protein L202_03202 [Cryptococcus amylolentus CBS 6039]|uniref:Uncharacterized protein n=1 Tax=Cryptococcus amylolentus CBS 6039 TaxID=1295533 RepID=A0A1E3HXT6_9TREE|nr:hypothetical protein L202_03202 [Cryptococcus amylolentus CBS 6039]ODN81109.1 hypothetical protein L202_03202 [Cryptococcus amylolentus CBS 6039]